MIFIPEEKRDMYRYKKYEDSCADMCETITTEISYETFSKISFDRIDLNHKDKLIKIWSLNSGRSHPCYVSYASDNESFLELKKTLTELLFQRLFLLMRIK